MTSPRKPPMSKRAAAQIRAANAEQRKVRGKLLHQPLPIPRTVGPTLLKLDNIPAHEPVSNHKKPVYCGSGAGLGALVQLYDGMEQLVVIHDPSTSMSSFSKSAAMARSTLSVLAINSAGSSFGAFSATCGL